MTVSEMKKRQKELGYTDEQLSRYSGIPLAKIHKILGSVPLSSSNSYFASAPRSAADYTDFSAASDSEAIDYETWSALEQILGQRTQSMIAETVPAYQVRRQGEYTLEDYYRIPDEHRMKLIDGVIYDMGAPDCAHQIIAASLFSMLFTHTKSKKGNCLPMISPLDVQLDCDDRTMVQPDVVIICDRCKIINRCIYGAPDFIAEVISPSSLRRDMVIKLNKYANAQVREYWLIDPLKQKVTVYDFEHDEFPMIYGFDAKIPVQIWNGAFEVNFAEIYEDVKFMYERGIAESD